jgi:hypothetical protein
MPAKLIEKFHEWLSARADYGEAGEKPIAIIALLTYMYERDVQGLTLLELLESHSARIFHVFRRLAERRRKQPDWSWSELTQKGELRASAEVFSEDHGNVSLAFSKVSKPQMLKLSRKLLKRLEKLPYLPPEF